EAAGAVASIGMSIVIAGLPRRAQSSVPSMSSPPFRLVALALTLLALLPADALARAGGGSHSFSSGGSSRGFGGGGLGGGHHFIFFGGGGFGGGGGFLVILILLVVGYLIYRAIRNNQNR